jgi:hypothetical protein
MRVIQVFSQGPQGIPGAPGQTGTPFFVKADEYNTWYTTSSILISSSLNIQSDTANLFLVKGSTGNPIFSVTQSGYAIIATQSAELTTSAPNGGMYFTSTNFFVGLD